MRYRIGTAAWSIPKASARHFPETGSHLERYSRRLNAVEINSSFYRDHKASSYARWAEAVPPDFLFSVKLSRYFTHETRLRETGRLEEVLSGICQLGPRLGVLLVQLPPSLDLDAGAAGRFFAALRAIYRGNLALEPRHVTWNSPGALKLMEKHRISRVIADPEPCPAGESPEPSGHFRYYRLHGSPVVYRSKYDDPALARWQERMESDPAKEVWCIFDNTALGHAAEDAVELARRLAGRPEAVALTA